MRLHWAGLVTAAISVAASVVETPKQPNIVFILTDDQDYELQSLDYMPLLQKHLIDKGTSFRRHYCTVAICCPSRVSLWTGKAAHNTNVTDVSPPYGGYPKFIQQGLNDHWLPVWLQNLGYNTYYSGKLFNSLSIANYDDPPVKDFNGSEFLLDPYTYEYFNASMSRNAGPPQGYGGQYSTDVVAEKAFGFLDDATSSTDRPFFLGIAPISPHADVHPATSGGVAFDEPQYPDRHAHLFKDYHIPRTPNFNPDVPSGVGWVKKLPKLNDTAINYSDEFVRARLRSLQSVDELVEEVVKRLEAKGLLDSTYIFYTSDNGYHVGQHRMPAGKECAFETDVHVPLIVRGPGVAAGRDAEVVSSHTDLTPTILKLAGQASDDLDGKPIPLTKHELKAPSSGEHVNVEFWGAALPEGRYGVLGDYAVGGMGMAPIATRNNTYKALRLIGDSYSLLYTVWCTGDKEYYDLNRDPYQMQNLLDKDYTDLGGEYQIAERPLEQVLNRVDSLLMVLKSCKAETCREPWRVLQPNGRVNTLEDALSSEYDTFYHEQPKVSFSSCQLGYLREEEGPQDVNVWKQVGKFDQIVLGGYPQVNDDRGHWSWWT